MPPGKKRPILNDAYGEPPSLKDSYDDESDPIIAAGRRLGLLPEEPVVPEPASSSQSVADQYQALTEQINPLIQRAEKAFAALRLGVTASVQIEDDADYGWVSNLRFKKVDKEWCLLLEEGPYNEPDPEKLQVTRLQAASREMRLKALQHLPALERALSALVETQVRQASETLNHAAAFVAELEARTSK